MIFISVILTRQGVSLGVKCMPALGGRIQVEFNEFDKATSVHMLFQDHPRNPKM